jgi:hypothetical protein
MAEPHHDPAPVRHHDGKFSSANETFADESGGGSRDDEVSIERIEKVYKYVLSFYQGVAVFPTCS